MTATSGQDGYVSLEVSPYLAMDTEATVVEARRLWATVDRENLMIKVPGTKAGLPAIRQLIGEGINVNVTLLFSQRRLRGGRRRLPGWAGRRGRGGNPDKIASVASFFVSRIDVSIDKWSTSIFAKPTTPDSARCLPDSAARSRSPTPSSPIRATSVCSRARVGSSCAAKGARLQRLLWASTGTKNKDYSDVLYVDELIGSRYGQHHAAGDDGRVPRSWEGAGEP